MRENRDLSGSIKLCSTLTAVNQESDAAQEQNHRAVDIRSRMTNLTRPELDRYIEHHADFDAHYQEYRDGHIHI